MLNRVEECVIRLTKEEALGLLELAMSCPLDLSVEQRTAIVKLGELCRECLRAEFAETTSLDSHSANTILPTAFAA